MEFLPGFAWPVPRAFASAVSACRFEQGDVLFDAADAYAGWKAGRKRKARFSVQVLDPPRSARSASREAEGSRFVVNWASPLTCEVGDRQGSIPEVVKSTQGRLFTCLWRGDIRLLHEELPSEAGEPPIPAGARDLHKQLEATVAGLGKISSAAGTWFVSVLDVSSEASLAKAREVESALSALYRVTIRDSSAQEAGIPDGDGYHPALVVRAVWVDEQNPEAVRERLKLALYGAAKSGSDRFKLERHGLLVGPSGSSGD
ncbi:MAG: hypothetical protein VX466_13530 [Myxococcota bacterium]|nr:hypothetical protein [Myxococcota bacterium]